MTMSVTEKKAYLATIIAIVLFGFSFMFLKIALTENGGRIFDVLSYRFILSSIIILLLKFCKIIRLDFKGKSLRMLFMMCLLQPVLYFILEVIGVSKVASSEAGMMLSVMPVFTIVMGSIFLKERITRRQVFFILVSISGIILINVMSYQPGNSSNLGRFVLLLSIATGSMYSILSRKLSLEFTPIERTFAMQLIGGGAFFMISLSTNLWNRTVASYFSNLANPRLLFPILYLGIGCSLVAFFLLNYAVTHLEVSKTSILTNLAPIVSILAGVLILNERFLWYHFVGSVIILLGVIGATWFSPRAKPFQ